MCASCLRLWAESPGSACKWSRLLDESHAIAAFKQQLGIHVKEEEEFGWIAEVGIQSPLPPRWTAHSDASSGYVYYVDHDRQVSSWENPLVPCLRRIVEIGRNYLKCYTAGYFEEQKGILWHQHKQELDKWHGPFMDDAGRQYFVNSEDGISSWQDPRIDAQYVFELESGLLTSLEEILPPARPDTPNFDPKDGHWKTAEGAEVLTLDSPKETQHIIASAARKTFRERKSRTLTTTAQKNARAEHRSTMERMSSVAERLRSLQMDDEEAQRLQLMRKTEARRQRRSGGTAASAPPALAVVRIPSSAEDQARTRQKPTVLDDDACPRPPLSRQDTVPPPPPPEEVMQEALAPNIAPTTSPSCAENFAPPAHPPSPQAGKRPVLHGTLERALSQKSQDDAFQGSAFAELELKVRPEAVNVDRTEAAADQGAEPSEPPCRPTRAYELLGTRVVLAEGDAALTNTGWRTWAGGWLLAKHFEEQRLEQPRRVLDLSCGTGLAGIALAKAGHEVVLCDLPMNVQTIKDNLARNRCAECPLVERACAVGYTWGRPLPKELQQPFDVVLCGDVLYHVWSGKLQQDFLRTLQEICCRNQPGPTIVFAGQVRSGRQENQVTEYIAEHLGYKEVPICLDPTWFRQPGPLVADAKYRLMRLEPPE
eukprot:s856_g18.t2